MSLIIYEGQDALKVKELLLENVSTKLFNLKNELVVSQLNEASTRLPVSLLHTVMSLRLKGRVKAMEELLDNISLSVNVH